MFFINEHKKLEEEKLRKEFEYVSNKLLLEKIKNNERIPSSLMKEDFSKIPEMKKELEEYKTTHNLCKKCGFRFKSEYNHYVFCPICGKKRKKKKKR